MRKVLGSHAQTAHVWAQRIQFEGRSSDSRMFFEQGIIYSYGRHFPIASHVKDLKGNDAVLFTTQTYSVSTSKHIGLVRQALRGDYRVFYVPQAEAGREKLNLERFDIQVEIKLAEYGKPRIRQTTRDSIAGDIASIITRRNEYGAAFVKGYKAIAIPENINALADTLKKDTERRGKAEAKARAKAKEQEYIGAENNLGMKRGEWAEAWRSGKGEGLHNSKWYVAIQWLRETHGILLRVKGKDIVTSAGAEFPITHAKKAFTFIRSVRYTKTPWHKNGKTIHLGAFQLDSIDAQGNVKAGCHTVKWEEIAICAERIGLVVHS